MPAAGSAAYGRRMAGRPWRPGRPRILTAVHLDVDRGLAHRHALVAPAQTLGLALPPGRRGQVFCPHQQPVAVAPPRHRGLPVGDHRDLDLVHGRVSVVGGGRPLDRHLR